MFSLSEVDLEKSKDCSFGLVKAPRLIEVSR